MTIELRAALESLHNPEVYSQAWVDCSNLLNLSKETLEAHFMQWCWGEDGTVEHGYEGADFDYYLELCKIEEHLVYQGLVYE